LSAKVPAEAAALLTVLPADLHNQEIDPAVGIVDAVLVPANAAPLAVLPSTGVKINVCPLSIVEAYVIVIAPVD
jgi:hypothetical protein